MGFGLIRGVNGGRFFPADGVNLLKTPPAIHPLMPVPVMGEDFVGFQFLAKFVFFKFADLNSAPANAVFHVVCSNEFIGFYRVESRPGLE